MIILKRDIDTCYLIKGSKQSEAIRQGLNLGKYIFVNISYFAQLIFLFIYKDIYKLISDFFIFQSNDKICNKIDSNDLTLCNGINLYSPRRKTTKKFNFLQSEKN